MIAFRVDGNSVIGAGHIMRCLSIADAAKTLGVSSIFLVAKDSNSKLIDEYGYEAIILDSSHNELKNEFTGIETVIKNYNVSVLVIDSYYVYIEYFKKIRMLLNGQSSCEIAYIDDLHLYPLDCDFLINYGLEKEKNKEIYSDLYFDSGVCLPSLLLGPSYAPLRAEFINDSYEKSFSSVENVIVLTGGADYDHVAIRLLEFIERMGKYNYLKFNFVVGALNTDKQLIQEKIKNSQNTFYYENVKNISQLMRSADIAISAGGTTLLELCACSVPIMAYVCADNQVEGVSALCEHTGARYLGDIREDTDFLKNVETNLDILLSDPKLRMDTAQKEHILVDGLGTRRIITKLFPFIQDTLPELNRDNQTF